MSKGLTSVDLIATDAKSVFTLWLSKLVTLSKPILFEFVRVFFDRFGMFELLETWVILHRVWQIPRLILSRLGMKCVDSIGFRSPSKLASNLRSLCRLKLFYHIC